MNIKALLPESEGMFAHFVKDSAFIFWGQLCLFNPKKLASKPYNFFENKHMKVQIQAQLWRTLCGLQNIDTFSESDISILVFFNYFKTVLLVLLLKK